MASADKTKTTLGIALIIFVMIAFVLAIGVYLLYQQKFDADTKLADVEQQLQNTTRENTTLTEQNKRLQDAAGVNDEEQRKLFDEHNLTGADQSFSKLIDLLRGTIRDRDAQLQTLQQQIQDLEKTTADRVAMADDAKAASEQTVATVRADLEKVQKSLNDELTKFQTTAADTQSKLEAAGEKAKQLEAIVAEVAKVGEYLTDDTRFIESGSRTNSSSNRKQKFDAAENAIDRLTLVREELQFAESTIRRLNAALNRLRVADPELQRYVRESIPNDDRIDGFDGRIVDVDERDRSVLLSTASTVGMRPGLILSVFDPDDPRPPEGSRKGVIEVIEVEGPGVARARLKRDTIDRPILAGDGVATNLWSPGEPIEVAVVGFVQLFGGDDDDAVLKRLIERTGARVAEEVTARTALLVDAGSPDASQMVGRARQWRKPDDDRRRTAVQEAQKLGIRVVDLDKLADMLGLTPTDLLGTGLPGAGSATAVGY